MDQVAFSALLQWRTQRVDPTLWPGSRATLRLPSEEQAHRITTEPRFRRLRTAVRRVFYSASSSGSPNAPKTAESRKASTAAI
jgi:hypothetical protein